MVNHLDAIEVTLEGDLGIILPVRDMEDLICGQKQ